MVDIYMKKHFVDMVLMLKLGVKHTEVTSSGQKQFYAITSTQHAVGFSPHTPSDDRMGHFGHQREE